MADTILAITELSAMLGVSFVALLIIIVWSLAWKGIALWKAARKKSLVWFIALLIVNTLGILEILYIFILSKLGEKKKRKK